MTPVSAAAQAVEPPRPRVTSESVHLTADAALVPADLVTPPFRDEARGLMRDLAAFLLDRHLRRLARMRNPVDLRLGRLLARLDAQSGPLALGFARLGDYVIERLGLTLRRARALVALARGLETLPRLAAAFASGEISRSQARVIMRIATPGTEAAWLDRARLLTVRRLDREVQAALAESADAKTAGADSAPGTAEAFAAEAATSADLATPVGDDEDAPGEWIDLPLPQRLRPFWDRAIELARRTSGSSDPVWACAEIIAADFIAGVPDLASLLAREADPAPATQPPGEDAPRAPLREDTDLFEEVLGALESEVGCHRRFPPLEGLEVVVPDATDPRAGDTPRVIDRRLRELVRLRQNVAWHQGRLLRLFVGRRLYRELGFLSFSRYCSERAGIGTRRAWELVGLERRLWPLPRITAAYRSGALSWVRAAMISRVATDRTEGAWLHLAGSVTVRRLEEEIAFAERTEEARLAGALPVGTLPIGLASPPGLDLDGRVQMLAPPARERAASLASPAGATGPAGRASVADPASPVYPAGSTGIARPVRLRFWAPLEVASLWHRALRVARAHLVQTSVASGVVPPADWQCLESILASFLDAWGVRTDPTWQRNHRIFERDGWRCRVPGCTSRQNLQVHHVVFRSRGGGDEDDNLAVLCAAHHLRGIHQGRLRCHALPEGLLAWEFAPDPDDGFLARYVEDVTWDAARASLA